MVELEEELPVEITPTHLIMSRVYKVPKEVESISQEYKAEEQH